MTSIFNCIRRTADNFLHKKKGVFNLEISMTDTIVNSNLADLAIEYGELGIDHFYNNPAIRDLPIVKTIIGIAKTTIDIRDYLFLKKVYRFLFQLKDIRNKDRLDFIREIEEDSKLRKRVGENLVLLLDRMNDMRKPDMLGRLFRALLEGKIDFLTFQKLSSALDRFNLYDEHILINFYSPNPNKDLLNIESLQPLLFCGLIKITTSFLHGKDHKGGFYEVELGKLFIDIALEKNVQNKK